MDENEGLAMRTALYAVQHLEREVANLTDEVYSLTQQRDGLAARLHESIETAQELNDKVRGLGMRIDFLEKANADYRSGMTSAKWFYVESLFGQERKIEGIKLVIYLTNMGLKEAKQAWEEHFQK